MLHVLPILRRNRRVIGLFAVMVVLPTSILTVLLVRALRSESVRLEHERSERQRQIVRLVEADVTNWLFLADSESAMSKALLEFHVDGGDIVFPQFGLSLALEGFSRPRPFDPALTSGQLTAELVTDQYYPRIQSFLRDFRAGRNAGAQHFLRLRALIVLPPGSDRGYVLDVERVREYADQRLTEFCAPESFIGALRIADANKPPPATDALSFEGLQFLYVTFSASEAPSITALKRGAFPYAMVSLVAVTLLASVFVHRAVMDDIRLSRLRSDFVAAVSHEFRSPLSSILALGERLESMRTRDADKLAEYHQIIQRDARRLDRLVTRLLDFAQIEDGRKVYASDRVDLAAIVCEAVESCRDSVRDGRLHVAVPGTPEWVAGDREALRDCVQNLIGNAVKYSPPDTPITISCSTSDGAAVVEVRDQGIGIPKAEQRRIFEKFYRGAQTAELNVEGVGIGLSLVKHVVEHHGGSVEVESEPGRGSVFRFHVPLTEG